MRYMKEQSLKYSFLTKLKILQKREELKIKVFKNIIIKIPIAIFKSA